MVIDRRRLRGQLDRLNHRLATLEHAERRYRAHATALETEHRVTRLRQLLSENDADEQSSSRSDGPPRGTTLALVAGLAGLWHIIRAHAWAPALAAGAVASTGVVMVVTVPIPVPETTPLPTPVPTTTVVRNQNDPATTLQPTAPQRPATGFDAGAGETTEPSPTRDNGRKFEPTPTSPSPTRNVDSENHPDRTSPRPEPTPTSMKPRDSDGTPPPRPTPSLPTATPESAS